MGGVQVKQGDVRMSEYLMHYGILGQKWGVRRYQNKDGSYTNAGKARRSNKDIYNESKNMSDDELRIQSNRLQAESNYRRLAKEDREASRSDAAKAAESFGKKAATAIVVTSTFEVGKKIVTNKLNSLVSNSATGSIASKIAERQNKKVDESFKKWKENSEKRADAIELGKKATISLMASKADPTNKDLKAQAKADKKAYKKAFKLNTTYRKGQIKSEVLSDKSRKELSKAKKLEKELAKDPTNKALKKELKKTRDAYNIDRAKARRAPQTYANRSKAKANLKRATTMSVKAATTATAIYAAKKFVENRNMNVNVQTAYDNAKEVEKLFKEFYKYV